MLRASLLVVGCVASVFFVGALSCGDDSSTVGICPPEDIPTTTADCTPVCNADGTWTTQCCGDPPPPPGCGAFECQSGTWQLDPGGCFSCPDQKPIMGDRCDDGARCDYPTTCGKPDQVDCVGGRWQLIASGC